MKPGTTSRRLRLLLVTLGVAIGAVIALMPILRRNLQEAQRLEAEATRLEALGSAEQALGKARSEVETSPQSADVRLRYAALLGQGRRYQEALEQLLVAAKLDPQKAEPQVALSEVYQTVNLFDMALEHARRAVASEPANPRAIERLAFVYLGLDWPRAALSLLKPAIATHPQSAPLRILQAQAYYQTQEYRAAHEALLEAQRLDPANPALEGPLIDVYLQMQQPIEAEKAATRALGSHPTDTLLLAKRATARREQGKLEAAAADAHAALQTTPTNLDARFELAQVLTAQNKPAEARAELERIVKQNLLYQRAAFLLGSLYAKEGRIAEAGKLQRAYRERQERSDAHSRLALRVQSDPEDAEAHYQKGLSHAARGETSRAVCELKEALRLRPADTRPRAPLAEQLRKQERPQEAEAALKGILTPY